MPPPHPTLRTGTSIWVPPRVAQRAPRYPQLAGLCRADVAIVGGGITGAIAAPRFAEAGVDAVVLEADRIGRGSTAASSALLLQEPDARLSALSERYGTATARRIWRLSHDAAHHLIALIEGLSTPAAIDRRDTIYFTTEADDVAPLHREYVARCRAGFDATWLTPRALRVDVGIPARAGIRTRGSAHCDPVRACEGVMREAVRAGARVFERSPARRIESRRRVVRIRTAGGVVEARQVVIATGYATRQFRPLAGRFRLVRTYVGPHRRYPGHAFALGYGGNGMTFGALAGRLLAEQWQGVASKDHALFTFDR